MVFLQNKNYAEEDFRKTKIKGLLKNPLPMVVISNKLRNFATAMCQSLKEIVTVSQNASTAISSFTRTDNTS